MTFVKTDILNPYNREIVSTDSYERLIDFLIDKYPKGFDNPTDISINGNIIKVDDYDAVLNDNDIIVLLDRTALPVGLIGGWFITALANIAISLAVSYIANKLFAPDAPDEMRAPSSVYNINNGQNISRFGSPVPIIYGMVRMYPSMIVNPYYVFEDNVEYLYHILCVSQGYCSAHSVLIGNDCITNEGDFTWKLLYQDDFYDIPYNAYGIHLTKTLSNPSSLELKIEDGESEKYTINENAEYIEFDYMYPNGLIYYESDGETTSVKTKFKAYLYTEENNIYTKVDEFEFYKDAYSIDPIQISYRIDVSTYERPVYISFEKVQGEATNRYITTTVIKRVKEIRPNEDFTNRYGDITLLACKIKATNAISAAGQVRVNGYFKREYVGNRMHEVLTDIYTNTTYGAGLSADDLDFPITSERVNCCYEESLTVFDAMRKPALAQGYSLFLAGMDVVLKKDAANTITSGMYNEMNILRNTLKAQYLFQEEYPAYDGYECYYIDGCGWIPRSVKYPETSARPKTVDLFGVVDYTNEDCDQCGAPFYDCTITYLNIVNKMSSNIDLTAQQEVSVNVTTYDRAPYNIFDHVYTYGWIGNGAATASNPVQIVLHFTGITPITAGYKFQINYYAASPKSWNVYYSYNGSSWTLLDSQVNQNATFDDYDWTGVYPYEEGEYPYLMFEAVDQWSTGTPYFSLREIEYMKKECT